ncbi:hypothetical protein AB0D94_11230 [Streptomyces sp. NPDC048255]|uniref:hypothetical protein n=1 Tax=Streptomyces sp. NPDC048255 TaxID=3154713 RepID=UPI0033DDDE89
MLKPTRTILALAAGSLVLGLVGAGVAVADDGPKATTPSHETVAGGSEYRSVIGKVVSRGPLKIRSKPTTRSESLGEVYPNRTVEIECKKRGESVDGNRIWYRLQEKWNEWENGNEENGSEEDGSEEDGSEENGSEENGTGENGTGGSGDWQNRPNRPGQQTPQSRKYAEERWVAARYVQNQSSVQYCR